MNYWKLSTALYWAVKKLSGKDAQFIFERTEKIYSHQRNISPRSIQRIFSGMEIDELTLRIACESGEFQIIADEAMRKLSEQIARHECARINLERVEEKAA